MIGIGVVLQNDGLATLKRLQIDLEQTIHLHLREDRQQHLPHDGMTLLMQVLTGGLIGIQNQKVLDRAIHTPLGAQQQELILALIERGAQQPQLGGDARWAVERSVRVVITLTRGRLQADRGLAARFVAGLTQQGLKGLHLQRTAVEIPLVAVAAELLQAGTLLSGLNSFGDALHSQAVGQGDRGPHDRLILRRFDDRAHEGAIDLQTMHRQAAQKLEGGIAGAEIINGDPEALIRQRDQLLACQERIAQQHRFSDLQLQLLRRQRKGAQRVQQPPHEMTARQLQLARRDVQRQTGQGQGALLPELQPLQQPLQGPLADRHDQAALLGQGDELGRGDADATAVGPAQQHLAADQRARLVHLGLDHQAQLLAVEGLGQLTVEFEALADLTAEGAGVGADLAAAEALGLRQSRVGALQQGLGVLGVFGIGGDADAEAGIEPQLGHQRRLLGPQLFDATGQRHRIAEGADLVLLHHQELIAAQPRQPGPRPQDQPQLNGDALQQLIAQLGAEAVVDLLETVDVKAEHRKGLAVVASSQPLAQLLQRGLLVGQTGEGIVVTQLLDLLPGRLGETDITDGGDHTLGPAIVIDAHLAAHLHPGLGTVEKGEAMPGEERIAAIDGLLEIAAPARPVVGMHQGAVAPEGGGIGGRVGLAEAVHLRRPAHAAVVEPELPGADAAQGLAIAEESDALLQPVDRALLQRAISHDTDEQQAAIQRQHRMGDPDILNGAVLAAMAGEEGASAGCHQRRPTLGDPDRIMIRIGLQRFWIEAQQFVAAVTQMHRSGIIAVNEMPLQGIGHQQITTGQISDTLEIVQPLPGFRTEQFERRIELRLGPHRSRVHTFGHTIQAMQAQLASPQT